MKESIIMTVSDREPELLLNTLRWISLTDVEDSEIVIVDDCSKMDYSWLGPYLNKLPTRWIKMEPYECCQIEGNYNNPAKAFNRAVEEARGENIAIVSSDCIIPPQVFQAARKIDTKDAIWCPMVIDLGSTMEYCGPHRQFPMPWFLYTNREKIVEAGGWDENYLLGMCYEDNDFVGRLFLTVGKIVCDWTKIVWHQSHYQPAYKFDEQWIKAASVRNSNYTLEKWTAIPFGDSDLMAFGIHRSRYDNGDFMMTPVDHKELKEKVIASTLSPFVKVPA